MPTNMFQAEQAEQADCTNLDRFSVSRDPSCPHGLASPAEFSDGLTIAGEAHGHPQIFVTLRTPRLVESNSGVAFDEKSGSDQFCVWQPPARFR